MIYSAQTTVATAALGLCIVLFSVVAVGQSAKQYSTTPIENDTAANRAVCGDGICKSFETGVCPEDCGGSDLQERFKSDDSEQSTQQATDQTNIANEAYLPQILLGLIVVLLLVAGFLVHRYFIGKESQEPTRPEQHPSQQHQPNREQRQSQRQSWRQQDHDP